MSMVRERSSASTSDVRICVPRTSRPDNPYGLTSFLAIGPQV